MTPDQASACTSTLRSQQAPLMQMARPVMPGRYKQSFDPGKPVNYCGQARTAPPEPSQPRVPRALSPGQRGMHGRVERDQADDQPSVQVTG
jgi:hypothetical protein